MVSKSAGSAVRPVGVDMSGGIPVPLKYVESTVMRLKLTGRELDVLNELGGLVEREQVLGNRLVDSRTIFEVLDRQPKDAVAGLMGKLASQGGWAESTIIPAVSERYVSGKGITFVGKNTGMPATTGFIALERGKDGMRPTVMVSSGFPLLSLPQAWMARTLLNGPLSCSLDEPLIPVGSFRIPKKTADIHTPPAGDAHKPKPKEKHPRLLPRIILGMGLLGFSLFGPNARADGPLMLGEFSEPTLLYETGPTQGMWTVDRYAKTDASGLSRSQDESLLTSLYLGWPSLRIGASRTMREGREPLDMLSAKVIHHGNGNVTMKGMVVYTQDHDKDGAPWAVSLKGGLTFPFNWMGDHLSLDVGGMATATSDESVPADKKKTMEAGAAVMLTSGESIPLFDLTGVFGAGVTSYDTLKRSIGIQLTPRLPKGSQLSILNAVTVVGIHRETDVTTDEATAFIKLDDNVRLHAGVSQTRGGGKETRQAFIGLAVILDKKK